MAYVHIFLPYQRVQDFFHQQYVLGSPPRMLALHHQDFEKKILDEITRNLHLHLQKGHSRMPFSGHGSPKTSQRKNIV